MPRFEARAKIYIYIYIYKIIDHAMSSCVLEIKEQI